jgi:hypothetical protein
MCVGFQFDGVDQWAGEFVSNVELERLGNLWLKVVVERCFSVGS